MKRKDARPQFAGLGNRFPEELFGEVHTPCYILDEKRLYENAQILKGVSDRTGAKMLLAQKAFSCYDLYPVMAEAMAGTEASGLYEAMLGKEKLPEKEVHVFCGAYREDEIEAVLGTADHIVFNSPAQLGKFGPRAKAAGLSVGLRINPECSTQEGHEIYDPCAPGSRLGTTRAQWDEEMDPKRVALLDGLHFHTLCEQNSDDLKITLDAVQERFGDVLPSMKWVNFGGGHHVTRPDYDIALLETCIRYAQKTWEVEVYLEPGEAWALNAGYLASRVLDVRKNGETRPVILDVSAACHMPDVLEMPYTPPLYGAAEEEGEFICQLGGPTCLAGDRIGVYGFEEELKEGDLLLFGDMAIYSICKNNTFNGMPLPWIYVLRKDGRIEKLRSFGYEDFRDRLGSI